MPPGAGGVHRAGAVGLSGAAGVPHGGGVQKQEGPAVCPCGESGSTLRFLIPIGLYSGNCVTYTGEGRLGERPISPYYAVFREKGVGYAAADGLPLTAEGAPAGTV